MQMLHIPSRLQVRIPKLQVTARSILCKRHAQVCMQLQCLDSDLLAVASAREADLQTVGSFSDCHSDAIGFRGLSLNIQEA